ncbi:MAG: class I SAM-dependent methyltransferase [Bacteroidales bacterium]|jgi:predicted O-methyltransferase YrrM|nr:class I SAM-dependent methyltransferase [Bacteroidales bacterium]MDD3910780.1 class I SAM-dependent methyltransferase [Bacteroidales bacterium]MDD4420355.1 class I SAM-dependent methyltransferase [Bacteroidales bacterium]
MNKRQLENIREQAKGFKEDEALQWLVRQTHTRTNHARMSVGAEEGAFLELFVQQVKAQTVLELGTFTGYSAIRLARGLQKNEESGINRSSEKNGVDEVIDFHLDAVEINDELEYLIREGFERAGVTDKISLHFIDAKIFLKNCKKQYDLVFIDANKREYPVYYELVFPLVKNGGYILVDNVLWGGKLKEALWKKEEKRGLTDVGQAGGGAAGVTSTAVFKPDILHLDAQTSGIVEFYFNAKNDQRVEFITLPIRDGLSIIEKK